MLHNKGTVFPFPYFCYHMEMVFWYQKKLLKI
jgi:hypothetical protein